MEKKKLRDSVHAVRRWFVRNSKKSPAWDRKIEEMMGNPDFVRNVIDDIVWHLQYRDRHWTDAAAADEIGDRWSLWWYEVASRVTANVDQLRRIIDTVAERRGVIDVDHSDQESIRECLVERMRSCQCDPSRCVFFTTRALVAVLGGLLDVRATNEMGRRLQALSLPFLRRKTDGPTGRNGFIWAPSGCDPATSGRPAVLDAYPGDPMRVYRDLSDQMPPPPGAPPRT